jgi:hypothetical protein
MLRDLCCKDLFFLLVTACNRLDLRGTYPGYVALSSMIARMGPPRASPLLYALAPA